MTNAVVSGVVLTTTGKSNHTGVGSNGFTGNTSTASLSSSSSSKATAAAAVRQTAEIVNSGGGGDVVGGQLEQNSFARLRSSESFR